MKTSECLRGEIADKCSILLQAVTAGINDIKRTESIFSAKWDNPRKYLKELIINRVQTDGYTGDKEYGTKASIQIRDHQISRKLLCQSPTFV